MKQDQLIKKITDKFSSLFGNDYVVLRSPGRINLIGEHTDYNDGFVLPAAINKSIYFAFSAREDEEIHLFSIDFDQSFQTTVSRLSHSDAGWPNYLVGVVDQLVKHGKTVKGFNCVFGGDIPVGAGLSSSAALENGVVFALNHLFNLGLERLEMVKLSQLAENEFVGVKCGIMDQFASMMGKKGHVIRLDCRSLEYRYEPFEEKGIRILLLDTGVKHSLASSEYNTRRKQCETGVALIQKGEPTVKSLRDANLAMVDKYIKPVDSVVYNRCKYVVEERDRLIAGCADLEKGDVAAFGQKMFRTHDGLSKEYEVSCSELDYLVDAVRQNPDVLGARMMGGGFGGCTINLVKEEAVHSLAEKLAANYKKQTGLDLKSYIVEITDGTDIIG